MFPILARDCMIPRDYLFLKESYYDVGGFDLNINLFEDWDLKIRLAEKFEYYFTGIEGIAYRRKGSGLSYTSIDNINHAMKKVFNKNICLVTDESDRKRCEELMGDVISENIRRHQQ